MVKILLADDHVIIRLGLHAIIAKEIKQVFIENAWDGISVMQKINEGKYDLIILDVSMPQTDSVQLVTDILMKDPSSKILMFSMHNEEIYAPEYLQIGAMGYLNKSSSEAEIEKALDSVLNNRRYLSSSLLESLTHDQFAEKFPNPFETLSKREKEILHSMLKGELSKEIAENLDLDSSTVATYKARILKKLNAKTLHDIKDAAVVYKFDLTMIEPIS